MKMIVVIGLLSVSTASCSYKPVHVRQAKAKEQPADFTFSYGQNLLRTDSITPEGEQMGIVYRFMGDTISYRLGSKSGNVSIIQESPDMEHYEYRVTDDGHPMKIFKQNGKWYGYYQHSPGLSNQLICEHPKDEVFVRELLRSYHFVDRQAKARRKK